MEAVRDGKGRVMAREYRDDPTRAPRWNKYRDLAMQLTRDSRMATQRGKAFFIHAITEKEFEAANRWADMLEAYDRLVLGRRRTPASPAMERLGFGEGSLPDPGRITEFRSAFKAAHNALLTAGKQAEAALTRLCRDEGSEQTLPHAKAGMQVLMAHFGLVKRR